MMNEYNTKGNTPQFKNYASNNKLSHKDCTKELLKLCHIKAQDWLWPWDNDLVELPCGSLNCGINKFSEIDVFSSLYNDVVAFVEQHAVPLTIVALCLIGGTLYLWGLPGETSPQQTAPTTQESPVSSNIAADGLHQGGYVSAIDDWHNYQDDLTISEHDGYTPSLGSPEHSDGEAAGQPFNFIEDDY